jgi:hypothetical protein
MKTHLSRYAGLVWLFAGLWLAVIAITRIAADGPPPALIVAAYAAFAVFTGYALIRGRRWAFWPLVMQASLLAVLSAAFYVKWGFKWNHGSFDWAVWSTMFFAMVTVAILFFDRRDESTA